MTTTVYHKSVTNVTKFNELRLRLLCYIHWMGTEQAFGLPNGFFDALYVPLCKLTSDPSDWCGLNTNNTPRMPTVREELLRIRHLLSTAVFWADSREVVGEIPLDWPRHSVTLFEGAAVLIRDALSHTTIEKKTKQVHTEFII